MAYMNSKAFGELTKHLEICRWEKVPTGHGLWYSTAL